MQRLDAPETLRFRDDLVLVIFCLFVFGIALVGGRYLTMHEAVLPQSAKEMYLSNEWIVPTSAGRPWLERPPLPQWVTLSVAHLVGRFDREWVVRIPSVLMGTMVILLMSHLSARWFGRSIGLLTGLSLATMLEFARYSWLAEQDIHLCFLVSLAAYVFGRYELSPPAGPTRFFGPRPWTVFAWFVALGMTNLAKGLVFGTVLAVAPVAAYLAWNARLEHIRRYIWGWGWLTWGAIAAAWPIAVYFRYPDVLELWHFDLFGRLNGTYTAINQPVWYYIVNLPVITAPWFLVAVGGMAMLRRTAWSQPGSPERFLWCWALAPIVVLTIPGGKHHHYYLSCMAPWAMLTAHGLVGLRRWSLIWHPSLKTALAGALFFGLPIALAVCIPGPALQGPDWLPIGVAFGAPLLGAILAIGLHHRNGLVSATTLFVFMGSVYVAGLCFTASHLDECRHDTQFFKSVHARMANDDVPVIVNADLGSMDIFRILFYLGEEAIPVHNLSFLREQQLRDVPEVYVLTRAKDLNELRQFGDVREMQESSVTRREASPGDRFALFDLRFRHDLVREPADLRVSPMQAMDRAPGPYLGVRGN